MSRTMTPAVLGAGAGDARFVAELTNAMKRPAASIDVAPADPFASAPVGDRDTIVVPPGPWLASYRNACDTQFMSNHTMSGEIDVNVTSRPSPDMSAVR